MAEFCPKCWNEWNQIDNPKEAYVLSWGLELCEGCGQWKRIVIMPRRHWILRYCVAELFRRISRFLRR